MDQQEDPSHDHPTDRRLMTLAPDDNVCVSYTHLPADTTLLVEDTPLLVSLAVNLEHKIARRAIALGEKLFKCGVPIGSATVPIAAGDHVHLHNMKSDYIPTHTPTMSPGTWEVGAHERLSALRWAQGNPQRPGRRPPR